MIQFIHFCCSIVLQKGILVMLIRLLLPCLLFSITPLLNQAKYNPLFGSMLVSTKPPYPCPGKLVKNMDEQELRQVLEYGKIVKDGELVHKTYFYLFKISTEQSAIKEYKLGLADYCFLQEDYEKASGCYEDFFMLYPGSKEAAYSQYKSILCSFYLSLSADRDQTATHKTISLINFFLMKETDQKFIDEVKTIYTTCRERLFKHEAHVFENYIKQQKFLSAEKRLEYIEKNFQDIKNIKEYEIYLKEMLELTKNPDTRPFLVRFDLKNALSKKASDKKEVTEKKSALRKISSFFLA
ncbi:MAG: outer membrane protein assembly factor BamD [Candidatus Babeliales bacterium]|jgi:outer membrane assembly lipoprotein YfiO